MLPSAWPLWGNTFRVWWARRWGLASEVLASHLLRSHGFGDVNLEPHPSMYPAETVKLYLVTMWIWPNGVRFVLIWSRSSLTVGFFPCEKGSKIQQSCIIKRLVAPAQASPGWRFQNALQVLAEKCFVAFSLPTWNSLLLFFFSQHLSNFGRSLQWKQHFSSNDGHGTAPAPWMYASSSIQYSSPLLISSSDYLSRSVISLQKKILQLRQLDKVNSTTIVMHIFRNDTSSGTFFSIQSSCVGEERVSYTHTLAASMDFVWMNYCSVW